MAKRVTIDTLKSGYHDPVEVLLHASFQVLVDFMEKEEPGEHINWQSDPGHSNAWSEMNALYDWWKVGRPNRFDPLIDDDNIKCPPLVFINSVEHPGYKKMKDYDHIKHAKYDKAMKDSIKLRELWNAEDQDNLHRLINIRFYLWT